jgi:uncharacterized protein YecE (DUF72 family)
MAEFFAGTSGFAYSQWKPQFYPQKLPAKKFLEYYASRLNAVEINYTFRRNPSASTIENWVNITPPGFCFCLKAHMRITHVLKLQNAQEATEFFLRSIDPLRVTGRLGVILFQLPPFFQRNSEVLEAFLNELPKDMRFAFEFRHKSWHDNAVYDLLQKHNACYCLAESDKLEPPDVMTADFAYFRLRKAEYPPEERQAILEKTQQLLSGGKSVFLFFKHEETPDGALYAEELLQQAKK